MPTTLLISDANIIIDMEVGGLIELMFQLNHKFAVPDVLYAEELAEDHPSLPQLGLQLIELRSDAVMYTVELASKYRRPGRIDLMALALAKQEACGLLTGDLALREAGQAEGIDVAGTIWLVGEMLNAKLLSRQDARTAYSAMKASGRRLPWLDVEKQLQKIALRDI